jgi:hypothetical protein
VYGGADFISKLHLGGPCFFRELSLLHESVYNISRAINYTELLKSTAELEFLSSSVTSYAIEYSAINCLNLVVVQESDFTKSQTVDKS